MALPIPTALPTPLRTSIPAHKDNHYATRREAIRVIVVHSGETPEGTTPAEGMGYWFQDPRARASTHMGVDADSICRYLPDSATAFGAAGCNAGALHLEHAGRASQTPAQWDDADSRLTLLHGAYVVATWCVEHDIPARWLTNEELRAGRRGVATHWQVSQVWGRSDHTDPGPGFPREGYMAVVQRLVTLIQLAELPPAPAPAPKPVPPAKPAPAPKPSALPTLRLGSSGPVVAALQAILRKGWPSYAGKLETDGDYGLKTRAVVREFQRRARAEGYYQGRDDGVCGPLTWAALRAYGHRLPVVAS